MRCFTHPNSCSFSLLSIVCMWCHAHQATAALLLTRRLQQCSPSLTWVSEQGQHAAGFDIAPGAAGVGIGPAAAVPAPSVEGFTSNGFGNAPPMMGSNPGLSLGEFTLRKKAQALAIRPTITVCNRGCMNVQL